MDFKDPKTLRSISDFSRVILGVLVALVWKEPIQYFSTTFLPPGAALFSLVFFALLVTAVAVIVMLKIAELTQAGENQGQQADAGDDALQEQAQPAENQSANASDELVQNDTTNDF